MPNYLTPGVFVEETSSGIKPIQGVGTATAAFIGFTERGPFDEAVLVTSWTQYAHVFGEFTADAYLPQAVYGYFLNGGGNAYIVSLGTGTEAAPSADAGTGQHRAAESAGTVRGELAGPSGGRPALTVALTSAAAADSAGQITVEVDDASDGGDEESFKLVVRRDGKVVEEHDNVTAKRGPAFVGTALKKSAVITLEEVKGLAPARPVKGAKAGLAPNRPSGTAAAVRESRAELGADAYIGDTAARTGLSGLEAIEDITMVAVPDLMSAYQRGAIDAEGVKSVQLSLIAHCEAMGDRVAILDPLPELNAQQMRDWRQDYSAFDSKYAGLYWPWVKVMNPVEKRAEFIPPSGHVAGVWARSDNERGVHKAPANEVMRGVLSPALAVTKGEQSILNPIGVNCLRTFPGQGVRIWGARTLSSDPEWRYLNVRRLFNYVEKSILDGTNWVVFEPNDRFLWESVSRTVTAFLTRVWRSGALFGRTPAEAFFVRCDEENNPPENRDAGILTIDIGIAPVKPAEFVVFRLSQYAPGTETDE
ncbi:phage tail sheath subtilisin-like domain-containing protein [Streptomyces baarnensis]|uniref:phage tail sheath family protein n=1 Tax=Streptomyces TaxID=1883 RepID=UPI0029A8FB3F|nr:phage tail sheath subtilisin-like domain-containing protein [Streptomyces sp. ME02-6979.5a]MDX3342599.1 phage tail sheath subtilisin-like domain-containing protein [Streptomyces sp. ME02-6979.5a]